MRGSGTMSMMKSIKLVTATAVAAAVMGVAARRRGLSVSMRDLDWLDGAGVTAPRRYRSPGHMLHHAWELAGMAFPIARVYTLRAIAPAFREQIMIVTAMANACPT